jgi:hypothetical protein
VSDEHSGKSRKNVQSTVQHDPLTERGVEMTRDFGETGAVQYQKRLSCVCCMVLLWFWLLLLSAITLLEPDRKVMKDSTKYSPTRPPD